MLVVDDDPLIRMLFALDIPDIELVEARSVMDALDAASEHVFDAVVVDRRLPDGDGTKLLQMLRADARLRTVPIVLLTAAHDPADEAEVLRAGADVYLGKPFDAPTIMRRLGEVIALADDERQSFRLRTAECLEQGLAPPPLPRPEPIPATVGQWTRKQR